MQSGARRGTQKGTLSLYTFMANLRSDSGSDTRYEERREASIGRRRSRRRCRCQKDRDSGRNVNVEGERLGAPPSHSNPGNSLRWRVVSGNGRRAPLWRGTSRLETLVAKWRRYSVTWRALQRMHKVRSRRMAAGRKTRSSSDELERFTVKCPSAFRLSRVPRLLGEAIARQLYPLLNREIGSREFSTILLEIFLKIELLKK